MRARARSRLDPRPSSDRTILDGYDLGVEVGAMSTLIYGPDDVLFAALLEAPRAACRSGKMMIVATISNACAVTGAA